MKKSSSIAAARVREPGRDRSFYYSVLLHAALIVAVIVGIDWKISSVPAPNVAPNVMNATTVDSHQIAAEAAKLKAQEEKKHALEQQRQQKAEEKVKVEETRLKKLQEEQTEVKRQKEAENRQLETDKQRLQQEKALATQQKKKLEEEKQQLEVETREAAEDEKQRETIAAKKKAELDKKHAKEDQRKKEAAKAEAALKDALAAEEAEQAAAAQASRDVSELARYVAKFKAVISNAFVYPDLKSGLKCTLFVRLIPGGEVIDVRVVESSGNAVFDRQAENAVRKASPLPVPDDPRLFEKMREIRFLFDPES